MSHIMLDLETYGTRSGCALRSIGAIVFTEQGKLGNEFYANIDTKSCLDIGMFIDPSTAAWWEKQSQEAKDSLARDQRPIREVLEAFNIWFKAQGCKTVWAQGANFDPPLIEEAFRLLNLSAPWKYGAVRDTRTAYHLADFDCRSMSRDGVYHNALDDCKHQVLCVAEAMRRIRAARLAVLDFRSVSGDAGQKSDCGGS